MGNTHAVQVSYAVLEAILDRDAPVKVALIDSSLLAQHSTVEQQCQRLTAGCALTDIARDVQKPPAEAG